MTRLSRVLLLCGVVGNAASSGALAAETTLCTAPETVVFSCGFKNAKIASVCSASTPKQDYVAYRFGKPGKVELTFQADAPHPGQVFHRASVLGASNADDRIWFTNRGHVYHIYMPVRGSPGLDVSRDGETVAWMECKGGWSGVTWTENTRSKFILDHGSGRDADLEHLAK